MNRVTTTVPPRASERPCVLHAMGADQIDEITSDPFNMAAAASSASSSLTELDGNSHQKTFI